MSGPIVRSGASPEFSKNWENVFGKAKKKPVESSADKAPPKKKKAAKKSPSKKGK